MTRIWDNPELPETHAECPRAAKEPTAIYDPYGVITPKIESVGSLFNSKVAAAAGDDLSADQLRPPMNDLLAINSANRNYGVGTDSGLASLCAQKIGAGLCRVFWYDSVTRTIERRDLDGEIIEG